jgi:hypothetical protein
VWTSGNGVVGRTNHEVTFRETQLIRQPFLVCIPRGPIDLIIVVVQPRDVNAGELGDFACRPADAAADVEDFHAFAQGHHVCEVVLVAGNGLVEAFTIGKTAEVEGATPAVFVDVCGEVVVAVRGSQYALTHGSVHGRSRSTHCLVKVAYSALRSWSMGQFKDGLGMLLLPIHWLTSLISCVSADAALLSQCLKYSSIAAFCAAGSFFSMDRTPPFCSALLPWRTLL